MLRRRPCAVGHKQRKGIVEQHPRLECKAIAFSNLVCRDCVASIVVVNKIPSTAGGSVGSQR